MVAVNPYLSFNGTCEAAFNFYKSVFGIEFDFLTRYKDIPNEDGSFVLPESEKEKIMHMSMTLTPHVVLMGADTSEIFGQKTTFGDNIAISLSTATVEETQRIFAGLSEGGQVSMPLEKTFWAELFGSFTDKFGVSWLINYSLGECE